ncbi:hypothetical protein BJX68DRAFT_243011 [Aspergillus pseudodeflectus]|uniref:Uncharacterized protein n=1 Tax=Aspergillus pseudodeflectus TaxID=176178 RepID=A0ABR4JWK4_9EURO
MDNHGLPPALPPRKPPKLPVRISRARDDDLKRLIARFNKQVSHVQVAPEPEGEPHQEECGLDLTRAADAQFPPERLQPTIERFYTSVIAPVGDLFSHVKRLRSWDDPHRTGAFCTVYAIAWLQDRLILVVTIALLALLFYPDTRVLLFPSACKAQTSPGVTGDIAPEGTDGGEAEYEGTPVVATDVDDASIEPSQLDGLEPETLPSVIKDGDGKPKKKVHPALNKTMRTLSDVTDICERVSNLLSPTPPFDPVIPRLRLAAILLSTCLISSFCSSYMLVKTVELLLGLGLFGEPLFVQGMEYLHLNVPEWKDYLDIDRTLLQGVPTNAQLALTLLRLAESTSNPIYFQQQKNHDRSLVRHEDMSLSSALWQALRPKPGPIAIPDSPGQEALLSDAEPPQPPKTQKLHRFLRFARRAIKTAVRGHIALDRALATTASTYARRGLQGVLDAHDGRIGGMQTSRLLELLIPSTSVAGAAFAAGRRNANVVFEAKFEKKRGCVVLDMDADVDSIADETQTQTQPQPPGQAVLFFTTTKPAKLHDTRLSRQKSSSVKFSIPLGGITELQKTAGLGWKGKLIVELAVGSEELDSGSADGLVIRGLKGGEGHSGRIGESDSEGNCDDGARERFVYHLTGVMGRDALFNRLVAGGEQVWELW